MDIITNFVQAHTLGVSATILIVAYIIIATEKIPKVTIALLGATIAILLAIFISDLANKKSSSSSAKKKK